MGYAGTDRRIPEIARELGVANIMEGSVQRAGKRVRINVQLIDAQRDVHLWAEIYDRELTAENLFDIQSEITKAIAAALNSALSSDNEKELQARPTTVLAAYDAFVAGRLLFNRMTPGGFQQAIGLFDKAIAEDPGFAAAWSAKAEALLELYWLFDIGNLELIESAREALERARVLAPEAVETQNALAHFFYYVLLDYDRAIEEFDRVLERAPSLSRAWAGKGFAMRRAGRLAEAIDTLEQAHLLDPLAIDPMDGIIYTSALLGRFERAWEMLEQLSTVAPANPLSLLARSYLYALTGDAQRRWEALDAPVNDPDPVYYAARLSAALGMRDPAKIESSLADWPEHLRAPDRFPELYNLKKAEALLALGRQDEANRLLNEVKARIDESADPYPHGWAANSRYFPVELPGLMGDLAAVEKVVAAYEADPPADEYSRYDVHLLLIAKAYAFAGDPESALDYLEQQVDRFGPARFILFPDEPAFDGLRSHPRFQAMKTGYEAWQAEQPK
jgi:tetratricopeptide (TPR) repeat protein